jgi:hypothetical protein
LGLLIYDPPFEQVGATMISLKVKELCQKRLKLAIELLSSQSWPSTIEEELQKQKNLLEQEYRLLNETKGEE